MRQSSRKEETEPEIKEGKKKRGKMVVLSLFTADPDQVDGFFVFYHLWEMLQSSSGMTQSSKVSCFTRTTWLLEKGSLSNSTDEGSKGRPMRSRESLPNHRRSLSSFFSWLKLASGKV